VEWQSVALIEDVKNVVIISTTSDVEIIVLRKLMTDYCYVKNVEIKNVTALCVMKNLLRIAGGVKVTFVKNILPMPASVIFVIRKESVKNRKNKEKFYVKRRKR
jgi:hypothetical protein